MRNFVKKKGAIGTIQMPIKTFLKLTSNTRLPRIKKEAMSVGEYNALALQGKINTMPFIRILPNGKVKGHEGRHRSWSLYREGERYIEVAIIVTKPDTEKGKGKNKTYETLPKFKSRDLPTIWEGQFSEVKLPVKLQTFKRM